MRTDQAYTRTEELVLAVSLELAAAKWKVALHDGRREKPAVHTVAQPQAAAMRRDAAREGRPRTFRRSTARGTCRRYPESSRRKACQCRGCPSCQPPHHAGSANT